MLTTYQRKVNIAGIVCVSGILLGIVSNNLAPEFGKAYPVVNALIGLVVGFSFWYACWAIAKAKGYSGWVGLLLPFLSIVGLIILISLKDRHQGENHQAANDLKTPAPVGAHVSVVADERRLSIEGSIARRNELGDYRKHRRLMIALGVAAGGAALGAALHPSEMIIGAGVGAIVGWVLANAYNALCDSGETLLTLRGKAFHFLMISALIILIVVLAGILIRHYWLLLFVWLALPFAALWLAGDIMRPRLSPGHHGMARNALVGAAVVLTIMNLVNMEPLRFDFGKQFIDGYQTTIIHDCEADSDGIQDLNLVNSAPPGICKIENLSGVAWYWRWFLKLAGLGYLILSIIVVVGTLGIGNSTIKRKMREDREAQEVLAEQKKRFQAYQAGENMD